MTVAASGLTDDAIPRVSLDDPRLIDQFAEFLLPSSIVDVGRDRRRVRPPGAARRPGRRRGWLRGLERAVNDNIVYRQGVTDVDTSVEHVVRTGQGVCQDMAHLFIALCRRQGVPARYISGWMHQAGRDEPSESHAWCEAWVPGVGWVEFDPTHPEPDLSHYIRVAVGRDYADVPPFRGTYVGDPTERMIVRSRSRSGPSDETALGMLPAPRRAAGDGRTDGLQKVGRSVSGG